MWTPPVIAGNAARPLCPECTRDVRGALYCENCLANIVASPPASQPEAHTGSGSHPGTALALGFIPGLGAVYNGEYVKALIHVAVFAGIIAALSSDLPGELDAFLGIALGCFYCYMPIEAYRVAKARQQGRPQPPDLVQSEGHKPVGAVILIGLGRVVPAGKFPLAGARLVLQGVARRPYFVGRLDSDGPNEKDFIERSTMPDDTNLKCTCARCRARGLMGPLMLIAIGTIFLLGRFTSVGFIKLWPLLLIIAGIVIWLQAAASRAGHTGA